MTISCMIHHRLGEFHLNAAFSVDGKLTGLFGPSGCGKTTVINAIAGLIRADRARIRIGDETLVDTDKGIFVPAHLRRIGFVFQDARLLPHLSVAQNLAYGSWFTPKADRYADRSSILAMLGIRGLMARRPRELSGGEKQRVALGRALLQSPRLLLMDEPLASLDEARKQEVLPYLERLRDEISIPMIYVSHSTLEVARLASDVVLLREGRVVAAGAAGKTLQSLGALGAEFVQDAGTPLELTVVGHDPQFHLTLLSSPAGGLRLPGNQGRVGEKLRLLVRSSEVILASARPQGLSALNVLEGTIISISANGPSGVTVVLRCGEAEIAASVTKRSVSELGLQEGQRAFAIIKSMSLKAATGSPAAASQVTQASR